MAGVTGQWAALTNGLEVAEKKAMGEKLGFKVKNSGCARCGRAQGLNSSCSGIAG
jgi:hypothetical protein